MEHNTEPKNKKIECTCLTCGKKFIKFWCIVKRGGGKFCSHKCEGVWKSYNYLGKNNPGWKGEKVKCKCKNCNKEFYVKSHRIRNKGGKFCSPECYHIWRSQYKSGKNCYNWKGGDVKCVCQICGKDFYAKPCKIRIGGGKFCSNKCYGAWCNKYKSGKNSSGWIHGKSREPYPPEWTEKFREDIRERDGRICLLCGKTEAQELAELGHKLSVHHVDYDKKNCKLDNLRTLCFSCNMKVNSKRWFWIGYFCGKNNNKVDKLV